MYSFVTIKLVDRHKNTTDEKIQKKIILPSNLNQLNLAEETSFGTTVLVYQIVAR
jgi:hypothetical protein